MYGEIKLFAGTASEDLAKDIADYLNITFKRQGDRPIPEREPVYSAQEKCARAGCLRCTGYGTTGTPQFDGAADPAANAAFRFSQPGNRCFPLHGLCPV